MKYLWIIILAIPLVFWAGLSLADIFRITKEYIKKCTKVITVPSKKDSIVPKTKKKIVDFRFLELFSEIDCYCEDYTAWFLMAVLACAIIAGIASLFYWACTAGGGQ